MNHTESRAFTIRRNQLDDLAEFGIEVEPPVVTRRSLDAHSTPWPRHAPMMLWIGICLIGLIAGGFAWIASAVLAWFARSAPDWVLLAIEGTILSVVGGAALMLLTPPRNSH